MSKWFFILGAICQTSLLLAVNPKEALQKLVDGNNRFASGNPTYPASAEQRRLDTASSQEPFAVILGCADSRVSPEIIFDQGIGDLFIVRVAGNVVGPLELDSIEYSALYLHSSIILVLGHESCGAVKAVLAGTTKDIEDVAMLIQPAVDKAKKMKGDKVVNAIKTNAQMVAQQLRDTEVLGKLAKSGKIEIHSGYYNFHDGCVEILD